jgi:hypothetical protein
MLHHTQENIATHLIKHSWNFCRIISLCKHKQKERQSKHNDYIVREI